MQVVYFLSLLTTIFVTTCLYSIHSIKCIEIHIDVYGRLNISRSIVSYSNLGTNYLLCNLIKPK